MIPSKLRVFYSSDVEYIQKLQNINVDVKKLLSEYEFAKHLMVEATNLILVQKKLGILQKDVYHPIIAQLPYTKQVIESLKTYYPYNSVYYRSIMPLTCYPWHSDLMQSCIHIPLQTHEACKFVYENHNFHMPADGSVYLVNNKKSHTAINASPKERLHITLDIL